MVKEKRTFQQMIEENPELIEKEKQIKFAKFVYGKAASDREEVKVVVYWGATGTGKTWTAVHENPDDCFIANCPNTKGATFWFDGYDGESILILDDFDNAYCSEAYLKRLLDHYKLQVQIKGGHVWACWTKVIITSNYAPRHWYPDVPNQAPIDHAPLQRRISEIRQYTGNNTYQLEDWNGSPINEPVVYNQNQ